MSRRVFPKVKAPRGARPYSPTSEVTRKGSFDLTVKIYPNGRVSEHLRLEIHSLRRTAFLWFCFVSVCQVLLEN